ncbi:ubiquitin C-terminal hydrolase 13-like [Macadamia integrifolia]|uniref:ubiquitin C-terminal hydrolase 13-like n=1 Tax=Macadamia integrifolia TaxID=60698 RepID=UPI001C52A8AA|nr:ubiquitin C-terminal hydrolase 13-like [Macadamia integrifolia]
MKLALEEQYGVEEMISHGFSNTFYDLMKYTNAYMLVYIRESEKENLFFEVVKGDIAEHLIEGYFSWNKELKEKERKKREKAEGHIYTSIKVARDEDLVEQIGRRGFYFDLVDHDKVRSYRVKKQMHFILFKVYSALSNLIVIALLFPPPDLRWLCTCASVFLSRIFLGVTVHLMIQEMVVEEFCIQVQNLRFWLWDKRQNNTYRPSRPLTCQEEQQTVGQLSEVSNETHSAGLKLFLEMELGPVNDMLPLPLPPPDKTKDNILLFFKLYDFEIGKLRYVGRLFVKGIDKPVDILPKLNEMAGFDPSEEIELYEEIEFQPSVKCEHIDKKLTFRSRQMEDGGIICFQKSKSGGTRNRKYLDVPSFLEYVHDLLVIRFRKLEEPNEDDFILELPKLSTYEDIVKIVDDQLNLNDTSRIRLTSHDGFDQSPYFEPIVYWQMEHLSNMLVDGHQAVDILYYEVLPQLEGLQTETIVSHSGVTDEVNNFAIPEEVEYIYNCCPLPLQNEENPEEGKNLGHQIRLIHIFHFTRDTSQNQMFFEYFGVPFSLIIHEGETLAKIKERIQMNWQFPEEKFVKWNFAFIPSAGPIFRRVLKDNDIVSSHFQITDTHGPWMQHLGLEHSYRTPNRDYDADTMVWKCPRPKGNPYGDEFGTNFYQQLSFSLSLSISIFSLASLFSYLF